MLYDGKKYACEACIKGHRVSGCNHNDRELHYIAPKGRPVKQCDHCRVARKSKSHHAKCDCGDKTDKDKKEIKLEGGSACCCHDGSSLCICGVKKDGEDIKPHKHVPTPLKTKPRLTTTHSESTLTVFANGHHKPCHRNNNAAHTSGAPYQIPKMHSHHGGSMSMSHSPSGSHLNREKHEVSPRSADDMHLPHRNDGIYGNFTLAQRSLDSLPLHLKSTGLFSNSPFANSPFAGSVQSHSPVSSLSRKGTPTANLLDDGAVDNVGSSQWPELTIPPPTSNVFGTDELTTSPVNDYYTPTDGDFSMPSAGLDIPSAGIEPSWSAGDLPLIPNKLSDSMMEPVSISGESNHGSGPGLTAASSGAQSEVGEPASYENDLSQMNAVDSLLRWDGRVDFSDPAYGLPMFGLGHTPTSAPGSQSTPPIATNAPKHMQQPQNIMIPKYDASTPFSMTMSENPSPLEQAGNFQDADAMWRELFRPTGIPASQSSSQMSVTSPSYSSSSSPTSLNATAPNFVPQGGKPESTNLDSINLAADASWDFALGNGQTMDNGLPIPLQPLDPWDTETSWKQWPGQ